MLESLMHLNVSECQGLVSFVGLEAFLSYSLEYVKNNFCYTCCTLRTESDAAVGSDYTACFLSMF